MVITIRTSSTHAGLDLPVFGHVAYKSLGFWAGLGVSRRGRGH